MLKNVCKKLFLLFIVCWFGVATFEQYLMSCHNVNIHQWLYPDLYTGSFNQKSFPIRAEKKSEYINDSALGYKVMKESSIVFCGLARDCADALPLMMQRMEEMGSFFKDYAVIIFENDSKDETRTLLEQWSLRNKKVYLLKCGIDNCKFGETSAYEEGACHKHRMERMAKFRNMYLDEVRKQYINFDYMMVIDMDIKGPWSMDGLATTFADCNWDGVFAYGIHTIPYLSGLLYGQYDAAAYVPLEGDYCVFSSYWKTVKNYLKLNFVTCFGMKAGDAWVPVASAFGGMGIYKLKSIGECRYSGESCEHAMFHKCMSEKGNGRFYINPSLILLSGHQGPPNPLQFLLRII